MNRSVVKYYVHLHIQNGYSRRTGSLVDLVQGAKLTTQKLHKEKVNTCVDMDMNMDMSGLH